MKASRFFNVLTTMLIGAAFGIIAYLFIHGGDPGENVIGLSWAAFFVMLAGIAIKQILNDNVYDKIEILQRKYDELKNKECDPEPDEKPETFRDRLKREHPKAVSDGYCGGCKACPSSYGYETWDTKCMLYKKILNENIPIENVRECINGNYNKTIYDICDRCWNRVIPNENAYDK